MKNLTMLSGAGIRTSDSNHKGKQRQIKRRLDPRPSVALSLVAAITFFSGFGSVATIAGFVTAGLAVALQNVILSVVAYFFLIGRYGLKAGDRVTVTGVTGDVIEVGLVRLSLLELSGSGVDIHSTGRVAVFSNSVIFQPSPLIRQAPGTDYAWHLITTVLVSGTDLETARKRLEKAVQSVFNNYREAVETQHRISEQTANIQLATPVPVSRARFTEGGVEVIVRYPVELSDMATVDEQMINSVMEETVREPKLNLVPGGFPKVTAA
ncbi:MAG: mechanosensitive ion channel family protein [Acidobacteriota bacterium]|nr:mechanosensitive ion channel family protein [Acidobacteriota bacterium]